MDHPIKKPHYQQHQHPVSQPRNGFFKGSISVQSGSRAAARSKTEHLKIIVNNFQLLTIITKRSILDFAAALDPPLRNI